MKCNKCPNAATLHITEIVSEDPVEELHLCEVCAHKYLSEPQPKHAGKSTAASPLDELESPGPIRECEMCGIKFVDFRNTHRLGRSGRKLAQPSILPERQRQQCRRKGGDIRKQRASAFHKEEDERGDQPDRVRRLDRDRRARHQACSRGVVPSSSVESS